jgi:CheY-like chemotaxis protein
MGLERGQFFPKCAACVFCFGPLWSVAKYVMITTSMQPDHVIFAADDDHEDLALLGLLLRKAGVDYPLQLFRQGEEVVASLSKLVEDSVRAVKPLLCFLDVGLATITGHEVLRWIRNQPLLNSIPVVMLTGSEHPKDVAAAAEHGAQCYLTKYPQPAVLREVIDDAQRFNLGAPADECFRLPTNQLLVRCRRLSDKH